MSILQFMFESLVSEPASVSLSVTEAMSSLMVAYRGLAGEHLLQVRTMLLDLVCRPEHQARYTAVRFAGSLFDFDDVYSRFLCLMGAAD